MTMNHDENAALDVCMMATHNGTINSVTFSPWRVYCGCCLWCRTVSQKPLDTFPQTLSTLSPFISVKSLETWKP